MNNIQIGDKFCDKNSNNDILTLVDILSEKQFVTMFLGSDPLSKRNKRNINGDLNGDLYVLNSANANRNLYFKPTMMQWLKKI